MSGGLSTIRRRPSTTSLSEASACGRSRRRDLPTSESRRSRRTSVMVRDVRGGDACVPRVEVGHCGNLVHPLPVGPHRVLGDHPALARREAVLAAGQDDAGREPLDVPLPGPGKRLLEVVRVEDKRLLTRGVEAEVREAGVAQELHLDAGPHSPGEVGSHHRCRTPVERVGARLHARVAQRNELRKAVRVLPLEDRERVAVDRQVERGVTAARDLAPCFPAAFDPVGQRKPAPLHARDTAAPPGAPTARGAEPPTAWTEGRQEPCRYQATHHPRPLAARCTAEGTLRAAPRPPPGSRSRNPRPTRR